MITPVNKDLLCKDCVHGFIPWTDFPSVYLFNTRHFYKCKKSSRTEITDFNPVTGYTIKKADYKNCWEERTTEGNCGPDAKYWAPKHKKDLFKLLKR